MRFCPAFIFWLVVLWRRVCLFGVLLIFPFFAFLLDHDLGCLPFSSSFIFFPFIISIPFC